MKENKEKAIDYCVDMNDENGSSMDRETTAKYLEADTYYTLYEACGMLNDKEEGSDNTVLDQRLLDVLDFFISVGNYKEGDQERFVGHTDGKLLNKKQEVRTHEKRGAISAVLRAGGCAAAVRRMRQIGRHLHGGRLYGFR